MRRKLAHIEQSAGQPKTSTLAKRFAIGMTYLLIVSAVISSATSRPYLFVVGLVCTATIVAALLVFILFTRWAIAPAHVRWQINLSSVFLIVVILSIYLSSMRWFVSGTQQVGQVGTTELWATALLASFLFLCISIPYILFVLEALMWFAVWIIRQRVTKSLLRRLL